MFIDDNGLPQISEQMLVFKVYKISLAHEPLRVEFCSFSGIISLF